jgi:hypothetical protein
MQHQTASWQLRCILAMQADSTRVDKCAPGLFAKGLSSHTAAFQSKSSSAHEVMAPNEALRLSRRMYVLAKQVISIAKEPVLK